MNRILVFLLVFFSDAALCLEEKETLSAQQLYDLADAIYVIRLTGGDYERGLGDGYYLRADVMSVLKGNPAKTINFDDGYDYSEPCFKRTLSSFYLVFLEKKKYGVMEPPHKTIWATGSAFEVEGGPRHWYGEERSNAEISKDIEDIGSEKAFFFANHVWYLKRCSGAENYNKLMDTILENVFSEVANLAS